MRMNGVVGMASELIERFKVKAAGPQAPARSLSGGNLQKFIMGREIEAEPKVLLVSQPTWGVDVGAAAQIRGELLKLRDAGCAVLVVSEELDELFEICDRLLVIAQGRISPSIASTVSSTSFRKLSMTRCIRSIRSERPVIFSRLSRMGCARGMLEVAPNIVKKNPGGLRGTSAVPSGLRLPNRKLGWPGFGSI